jgi:predicted ester cyclase
MNTNGIEALVVLPALGEFPRYGVGRRRSAVDQRGVVVTQVLARSGGGTVVLRSRSRNLCKGTVSLWMSLIVSSAASAVEAEAPLVEPVTVIVDRSLPKRVVAEEIQAARRYATFWSSGKESLARAALSPDFMDRTLPDGRQQGIAGPIAASAAVHAAIPDIRCDMEQLIVARDRVVVHLNFTGHFTGEFKGIQGRGQSIHFIATDIYRIVDGRIAENWHLEDNLVFFEQLGLLTH